MDGAARRTLADGRYRLLDAIGSGGMATVYRAYDTHLHVHRAVKILLPTLADRKRLRARFEAEARIMANVEHRNILRVYDVGKEENHVFIVMELVEGGSLVDRLETWGPLPPLQAVDVCLDVLSGLAVAHAKGVVHRDIKPHNVLLTREGEIRVADFGIARLMHGPDSLTQTGAKMGTWGFMAPEQRVDSKTVDGRADLYAVGATLYACVTNETPMDLFAAELDARILARVPVAMAEVVGHATRYAREDRFADAQAMADALRGIRSALEPVPANAPPLVTLPRWTRNTVPDPDASQNSTPPPPDLPEPRSEADRRGAPEGTPVSVDDQPPPTPAPLAVGAHTPTIVPGEVQEDTLSAHPTRRRRTLAWIGGLLVTGVVATGIVFLADRDPPRPASPPPSEPQPVVTPPDGPTTPIPPEGSLEPEPNGPGPSTQASTGRASRVDSPESGGRGRTSSTPDVRPELTDQSPASAVLGQPFTVTVRIPTGRYRATLYYRPARPGAAYRSKPMTGQDGVFQATVTPDDEYRDGLEYHVKAVSEIASAPDLFSGSGFLPHRIPVAAP
ncbi:MAG: protein kinase [Deltaproteobacteria bacterium]|nr:protein kinase [Deltaproteobacteria bacterium]